MGLHQSKEQLKDRLLYQQVRYGNPESIKRLRNEGASLEVMHHAFPYNNQGPNIGPAARTITAEDPADLSETIPVATTGQKEKNGDDSSSCVICLSAPVEGAFIPCGHMAGCMSCLTEIKAKSSGCPICRANIDKVIRL